MFKTKTLFVIGAGASAEAELPIGRTLAQQISRAVDWFFDDTGRLKSGRGSGELMDILSRRLGGRHEFNNLLPAARKLAGGLTLAASIDQYLDTHITDDGVQRIGKAAILYHLLVAERGSRKLFDKEGSSHEVVHAASETWYHHFAGMLIEGVRLTALPELFNNVSIVCFNYDRCIEHYLPHAIATYYAVRLEDARSLMGELEILHPYGTLGPLEPTRTTQAVPFGTDPNTLDVINLSERIRTFTEQVTDGPLLERIRGQVRDAQRIVFLGFGYLDENVRILVSPETGTIAQSIYGTAMGESEDAIAVIRDALLTHFARPTDGPRYASLTPSQVIIQGCTCTDFLKHYRRRLMS